MKPSGYQTSLTSWHFDDISARVNQFDDRALLRCRRLSQLLASDYSSLSAF
jgi:hypothetical protein